MHMWKKRIYADAAAATPLSAHARATLVCLLDLFGNPGGLHVEAVKAKEAFEHARTDCAAALGAHADEIVFVASGTEANNLALRGTLLPLLRERGSVHAVTTAVEHPSVLEPLRALESAGLRLTIVPVDTLGCVDPSALADAITHDTALVSVQLINSEVGTIQPIRDIAKEIRRIKKERVVNAESLPLYLHTDAAQAPLWLPLMVERLGIDLMTLDAQKIMGPKGVGLLYIKRGTVLEAVVRGGGQERGLRSGTENLPLVGAFAVALVDAQKNVQQAANVSLVRDFLWQEIVRAVPEARLHGASGQGRVANNLSFSIPNLDGQMAVIGLDALGVAASTRSACSSAEEAPSHVLVALGLDDAAAKEVVRITLLPSATKSDAKYIARMVAQIAKRYRIVV